MRWNCPISRSSCGSRRWRRRASITPTAIREAVKGQEFDAPNGHVKIEPENLHTYLTPRIAQWQADGQGKIIDAYKEPIIPLPYVAYGETENNLFCTAKGLDTSKLRRSELGCQDAACRAFRRPRLPRRHW